MSVITLPYRRPPLTPNQRLHWAQKSKLTREIRSTTCALAKAAKVAPVGSQAVVTTIWFVPDRRKRDVGALTMTAKAAIDGLVDAAVLPADDWQTVVEERYRIALDRANPRIEIHVEEWSAAA